MTMENNVRDMVEPGDPTIRCIACAMPMTKATFTQQLGGGHKVEYGDYVCRNANCRNGIVTEKDEQEVTMENEPWHVKVDCPHCRRLSSLPYGFGEIGIHSGDTMPCSECGESIVFDVWAPEDRARFYEKEGDE